MTTVDLPLVQKPGFEAPEEPSRWEKVDALFAGEPPPAPLEAGPRIQRLRLALALAIPLNVLGIPCWTGVPGAALTLWAWLMADGEVARIEAGDYSTGDAAVLMRLRTLAWWTLAFCVVSLMAQIWLLSQSFYNRFYDRLFYFISYLLS